MVNKILPVIAMTVPLFFFSCDDDPIEVETSNIVEILDDVTEVTTWYSDSIYLIKAWDFYVENTLTIQPGTVIKFTADGPYMILGASGTVIAAGTAGEPIVFTSWKDDSYGGDTNGDDDATAPAVKDWGYISTNDANGSRFEYCEFYYGGDLGNSYTLQMYGNGIKVDHCTFAHNAGDNATGWYGALDATYGGSACQITNNLFYDNVRPLSISLEFDLDNSNSFSQNGGSTTNQYNGIFVESINDVNGLIHWGETEVPYVIDDNDWWINSGGSLTLADNVCLKFRPDSELLLDDTNAINNHDGPGVVFTSYKDDTQKGDTNGDGSASTPTAGDWGGIYDNIATAYVSWGNIYFAAN